MEKCFQFASESRLITSILVMAFRNQFWKTFIVFKARGFYTALSEFQRHPIGFRRLLMAYVFRVLGIKHFTTK